MPRSSPPGASHVNVLDASKKASRRGKLRPIAVASENRWIKLRVSANGLRTIDKNGIDVVLAEMRARGEKV